MSRAASRPGPSRLVDVLVGVAAFAAVAALLGVAVLAYDRTFVRSVDVKLRTDALGSSLQKGSDVKLHGVPVGKVSRVRSSDDGAVLTLALSPDVTHELAPSTTARLLPTTLFGERYVDLVTPVVDGGSHLRSGDVIDQDASAQAAELQHVLDGLLPLLQSIQPDKLQASLSELATMLRGRGAELGDTLSAWGDYLAKLQPQVPQIATDLGRLAKVADTYATAAPDLLDALDALTTTSGTIVDEQRTLTTVYRRVIDAADTTGSWVGDHQQTIEVLSDQSRKALEAAAPYATEFPCLLRAFRQFVPAMDRNLGKGTSQPGLHVVLNISKGVKPYRPGVDAPTFTADSGPSCPYVPSSVKRSAGRTATQDRTAPRAIAAPDFALEGSAVEAPGVGQANSPAENQLIAELMAPTQDLTPREYPRWGSLLLGPVLRGTTVEVR